MKVSIITITRNNAAGLRRTIDSVASQRHVNTLEHIIVDGESTDNTPEIIAAAPTHPVVTSQTPRGVYNAINAGLRLATGDIVGLLHAGDVFSDRHVLDDVCSAFRENPGTDFIFGDVHFAVPGGRVARYYSAEICSPENIPSGIYPPHPSLYMRRHVHEKVGFYDDSFISAGDFEMFIRLFCKNDFNWLYLPRDMVCMQPGGVSSTLYYRLIGNNRERLHALRQNGIKPSYIRLFPHYIHAFKSYLWRHPRKK